MVEFLFGFFAEFFAFLLSFLLVFAIVYGILATTRFLSDRPGVNSLVAFAIGMLFAFSGAFAFIFAIIPYFALMIVLFAAFFLLLFFFGFRLDNLDDKTKKVIVWSVVIISVLFILFAGWKAYYDDVHAMYELYSLQNASINETELSANLTGNPFNDIPLRYEYQCTLHGRYLAPILFFGQAGVLCLVLHPRVIGAFILLPVLALIVYVISRWNLPKT